MNWNINKIKMYQIKHTIHQHELNELHLEIQADGYPVFGTTYYGNLTDDKKLQLITPYVYEKAKLENLIQK